jgi:hypothetical protein
MTCILATLSGIAVAYGWTWASDALATGRLCSSVEVQS